ncbi:MAG: rhodanese-like domain-containing protein [Candidatus Aenigmarchaeota archaeon]|nr:rhodanese-like domain-containing protein [Candidatus Aenigmarchaeota archaeon]
METTKIIFLSIIFGALAGAAVAFSILSFPSQPSQNELIKDFYLTENAAHFSPHSLRKMMDKGDTGFILVDLRSQEEYEKEHIIGAVSIPAYKDKDTSDYGAVDRIVGNFSSLPKNKDIIVYCYSIPCMTGRKVGKILAEHDIFVKQLGIGWNEWRYDWTGWNHEHEWNITNVSNYVFSGPEPGIPKKSNSTACPIEGQLGC